MIRITIEEDTRRTTAEIPSVQGPAFRAAIAEIRNEVGARLEGSFTFAKEHALTSASAALGTFGAALNEVIEQEDEDYA